MTKQHAIFKFIQENEPVRKARIVREFRHWYYTGADRYIGLILTRMLVARRIEKVSHGVYATVKMARIPSDKKEEDPNQLNLF